MGECMCTCAGSVLRGFTRAVAPLAVLLCCTVLPAARADVFHLKSGGRIVGDLIDTNDGRLTIRTTAGQVRIVATDVERVEQTESFFAEYDRRAAATGDSAAGHTELATWCDEQGLRVESRKHLLRALEFDPDYEPARRILGFVRVNGVWVDGRSIGDRGGRDERKGDESAENDEARLLAAVRVQWQRRIRAIHASFLTTRDERQFNQGRDQILRIDDPAAILPLTRVLGVGDESVRRLLVEALARFSQDESTLNLAVIGLADGSANVRAAAHAVLLKRNDPRVVPQYRKALFADRESLVRNAAEGLARLDAKESVADLIRVLKADRVKSIEVPVKSFYRDLPGAFCGVDQTSVLAQTGGVVVQPIIGVTTVTEAIDNVWATRRVTVFRTEVLEALKKLTGRNFGFELDEWAAWYKEQNP